MEEITIAAKALALAKRVVSSKWLYLLLAMIAIGGGLYAYLNHSTHEQVRAATQNADQKATNTTLLTNDAVNKAVAEKETKFVILHDKTVKDYTNARATLNATPVSDRDAQAPRVLIDTLNDLDRLRAGRDDSSPISNADVPVG